MIEFFKHAFGLCGEHWHPNFITALTGSPMIVLAYNWIKCKCGEWFGMHKKGCEIHKKKKEEWKNIKRVYNKGINYGITEEDIYEDIKNCGRR